MFALKEYRKRHNLSQKKISAIIDKSQAEVYEIERDKKEMDVQRLRKFLLVLKKSKEEDLFLDAINSIHDIDQHQLQVKSVRGKKITDTRKSNRIGAQLTEYMKRKKLKVKEIASLLKMSVNTIHNYKKDKGGMSRKYLRKFLEVLWESGDEDLFYSTINSVLELDRFNIELKFVEKKTHTVPIKKLLNKVHAEDCLNTMKKMSDECIDLTVTSPPYDKIRTYYGKCSFEFEKVARELFRVSKHGAILVWIVADQVSEHNESGTSFRQALFFKKVGFRLFDTMIYQKSPRGSVGSNRAYHDGFEYMFVFSKGVPKTTQLICDRKNVESRPPGNNTRRQRDGQMKKVKHGGQKEFGRRQNVWLYRTGAGHSASDKIAYEHPAIFPEKLAEDHIASWSEEGDVVYDPFMGSGTTAKMAMKLKRRWLGSEVNEEYVKIAKIRCAQKALI